MRALKNIRRKKMIAQGGLCYYCAQPMWDTVTASPMPVAHNSARMAEHLRCTAEHLVPRSEGGVDSADNIVAACWLCNNSRHWRKKPPSPEAHRAHVRKRIAAGAWPGAH